MKVKKVKKKGRGKPESLAKDTLKFAIANGTIKDILWDHDEQKLHSESESSEEEDLEDHAIEVFNELLIRNVPSAPESELLCKYRQQFIHEHSPPNTKHKHHLAPFPPTQEKGTYSDSPTRSRQTKLVHQSSGNPLVQKQPPFDRSAHRKYAKPGQTSLSIADPLPLAQLGPHDDHETRSSPVHQHKHHHHDPNFDNHTHVNEEVCANLTQSLDLQFRPTSFGNLARSVSSMSEDSKRSSKRVSGFNLSSKGPEYRSVHEELNIIQDDDVLWGGVLGPNRNNRRTLNPYNKPDEQTMAELFDLSHTLRRERELSTASAAANLEATGNKQTKIGGATTHNGVLSSGVGSDGTKKQHLPYGSKPDAKKQVRKTVVKKTKTVALPTRAAAVPTANQDFQAFWNEECSHTVSERFKVPGIDTKSNLNTKSSGVTTVTEEGVTEPEVIVDEKEELRNRARELVASLHNFSAIDTKSTESDASLSAVSHSKEGELMTSTSNTTATATATATATSATVATVTATAAATIPTNNNNDMDVTTHHTNHVPIKSRHSVHITAAPSALSRVIHNNNTRNTILSTTNSDTISKLFPLLQHQHRSPDSPAPPTVTIEAREAPAPILLDINTENTNTELIVPNGSTNVITTPQTTPAARSRPNTGTADPTAHNHSTELNNDGHTNNNADKNNNDNDEQSVLSEESSMNDSIEYASQDNLMDSLTLPALSLSAELDTDSVSINLSSPRQKSTPDADLSSTPTSVTKSTSKKQTTVAQQGSSTGESLSSRTISPTVPLSPGHLKSVYSDKIASVPGLAVAGNDTLAHRSTCSYDTTSFKTVPTRIPQAPATQLTSLERPRSIKVQSHAEEDTTASEGPIIPTTINISNVSVSRNTVSAKSPHCKESVDFTDSISAATSMQSLDAYVVSNIHASSVKLGDKDTMLNTTGEERVPVHSLNSNNVSSKSGKSIPNSYSIKENQSNKQPSSKLHTENVSMQTDTVNKSGNISPVPYLDVETALSALNVTAGDLEQCVVVPTNAECDIAQNEDISPTTGIASEPPSQPHSANNHRYHTVNMLPFGLEHLRGIWPYDPSISAYQYMLQLYATRRMNEQKQRERQIQLMRARSKQKRDRKPLHMKHALSETYQVLTFDPEHLNLVLTTHSASSSTPLHSINVSIQSTYITENHTTNMITLRTNDPAVPSGYLATYSVSQYMCMENEINAALAAYELSRSKLQHSGSDLIVVATDPNSDYDNTDVYSVGSAERSNTSAPIHNPPNTMPYTLSTPPIQPLPYTDEGEESNVFLTASTGATLTGTDVRVDANTNLPNDTENFDISIQQLRHYAEQGYASFLEMLYTQEPPVPEEPLIIAPSPRRPECFPNSVLGKESGPVRPFLLPVRPYTLHTSSIQSLSQYNNSQSVVGNEGSIQRVTDSPEVVPVLPPSRFEYLIKDALAAVKAVETEREQQRLLELQRTNHLIAPTEPSTQSITLPLSEDHRRNFRFYDPHSQLSVYELQSQLSVHSSVYHDSMMSESSINPINKGYSASGYVVRGESVNFTIEGAPLKNTQECKESSSKSCMKSSKYA